MTRRVQIPAVVQWLFFAGQNYGKISRITEYKVELTEIIPNGIGGWIERQASISISE